jgi:hypothetical protein
MGLGCYSGLISFPVKQLADDFGKVRVACFYAGIEKNDRRTDPSKDRVGISASRCGSKEFVHCDIACFAFAMAAEINALHASGVLIA